MVGIRDSGDLGEFVREARAMAHSVRSDLAMREGRDVAMYLGNQWLKRVRSPNATADGTIPLPTVMDPDATRLRATLNRLSRHVQRIAATTRPDKIEAEARPSELSVGPGGLATAQVIESAANTMLDSLGYVRQRRRANWLRTIVGTAGVALTMHSTQKRLKMEGDERALNVPDRYMRASVFLPHQLVLDPANGSPDLLDHDFVMLEEVLSAKAIEREYGVRLDEKETRPMGRFTQFEMYMADLTGGRMYAQYRAQSRTPGARVTRVYTKDDLGRFSRYGVMIDVGEGDPVHVQYGRSPWGGCQLPIALYHGHFDPDSPFGISDAHQLSGDQRWYNMYLTFLARVMRNHAHFKWLWDRRAIPSGTTEDDLKEQLTNEVGGVTMYDGGRKDQNVDRPHLVTYPPPPSFVMEGMNIADQGMREMGHRSEGSYGVTKSHVPDSTYQQALIEGDKVLSARVGDDMEQDVRMIELVVGTTARLVKATTPGVLAILRDRAGFTGREFLILANENPHRLTADITIRESSIRQRSHEERRRDLDRGVQAQAITPDEFRAAMASDSLDTPLTATDRQMHSEAVKAAEMVGIGGQPWEPIPLGRYSSFFIGEFTKMMMDIRVKGNPQAVGMLRAAIEGQQQQSMEDLINSDPKLYMERQIAQQQAAAEAAKAKEEEAAAAQEAEAAAMQEAEAGMQPLTLADVIEGAMGGKRQNTMPSGPSPFAPMTVESAGAFSPNLSASRSVVGGY